MIVVLIRRRQYFPRGQQLRVKRFTLRKKILTNGKPASRPARSGEIGERLEIADQDRAFLNLDDPRAFPVLEMLVDAFPRAADQLAERALRDLEPEARRRRLAYLVMRQPKQDLGDPRLEIEKGEILDLLVGAPQPLAQYDHQLDAELGAALQQP